MSDAGADYYALLNIPRSATAEEVRNAYKRMCVLYHPDKHLEEASKSAARAIFTRIHTAYTVLSDARLRPIYDEHGIEGVEAAWQVGPYLGDDLERLREEIRRRRVSKLLGGLRTKTVVSAGIDASMLMEDWSPIASEMTWSDYVPQLSTVSLSQHMDSHLSEDTAVNLTCSAAAKSGMGSGVVQGGIARQMSQALRGRLDFAVGSQNRIGAGLAYALTQRTSLDLLLNAHLYGGEVDPGYQATISRLLLDSIVSSVTVMQNRAGTGVSVGFSRISETNPGSLSLQYAGESVAFAAKYAHQLDEEHTVKTRLSSGGPIQLSLSLVRRPADGTGRKMTFALEAGASFGVGLKLGYSLHDLHLVLPLYISRELSSHSLLLGAGVPTLVGFLLHNLVLGPIRRWQQERYWREFEASQASAIQLRREEAQMASTLMQPFYERRVQQEQQTGLVILRATYERASPMYSPVEPAKLRPEDLIDVTVPLQLLVCDSHLHLPATTKSGLLGFYDVAVGQGKILRVEYLFKGSRHQVIVRDDCELAIPLRHHLISEA